MLQKSLKKRNERLENVSATFVYDSGATFDRKEERSFEANKLGVARRGVDFPVGLQPVLLVSVLFLLVFLFLLRGGEGRGSILTSSDHQGRFN